MNIANLIKLCNVIFFSTYTKRDFYSFTRNIRKFKFLRINFVPVRRSMELSEVVKVIEKKVPLCLAEKWDNTGLLIDPPCNKRVKVITFTNDLTTDVLNEAIKNESSLILSYHPLIFAPIKSLRRVCWKDNIVMKCIQNSIAVYSPHTACDAVCNGVNDWLINCFSLCSSQPIKQSYIPDTCSVIEFLTSPNSNILEVLKSYGTYEISVLRTEQDMLRIRLRFAVSSEAEIMSLLSAYDDISSLLSIPTSQVIFKSCGMGRIGKLEKPLPLKNCIQLVKKYLNLEHIRFAQGKSHSLGSDIHTVAVCAGSGASILKGVNADLYITGEMSHHDLLDANHKNVSVILCEHSNSERGYLQHLIEVLKPDLPGVMLIQSCTDKDPITFV